jgi:SAM-dependent methyltransferase
MLALGACACTGLPAPRVEEAAAGTSFSAAVPYVPTRPEIVDAMLDMGGVGAKDIVYDLGCGDGRIVIAAAKRFGASGLGVDIQTDVIAMAEAQAQWEGVTNQVKFALRDLFDLDLRPATVVMLYLSVDLNVRLRPKLLTQLRPGSRIVSNRFDMADVWRPTRSIVVADTPIHLWRVGAGG